VETPVGDDRAAAGGAVDAVERGEPAAGLDHDGHQRGHVVEREIGLGRHVDAALGEQHVRPEVPVGAAAPDLPLQVEERLEAAGALPFGEVGVRQRGVAQVGHGGDVQAAGGGQAPACPGAGPGRGPPAAAERGCRDHAEDGPSLVEQRDERRPHRDAADVVLGAVDGVDDPLPRAVAAGAELLPDDGVARPGAPQLGAHEVLGVAVGVGDGRQVGLGVHPQVGRLEPGRRQRVDHVGDDMGQPQVVVVDHHPAAPSTSRRSGR